MGLFTLLAADYRVGADHGFQWVLNEVEIGIVPPLYAFKLLQYRLSAAWVGLPRGLLSRRQQSVTIIEPPTLELIERHE